MAPSARPILWRPLAIMVLLAAFIGGGLGHAFGSPIAAYAGGDGSSVLTAGAHTLQDVVRTELARGTASLRGHDLDSEAKAAGAAPARHLAFRAPITEQPCEYPYGLTARGRPGASHAPRAPPFRSV